MERTRDDDERPSLILYASETGTAEEVAFKMHKTFTQRGLKFSISSLDDYEVSLLPMERCIVWVVATSGEGEVPSSMKKFWNFMLRKSLSAESLKGVSCAVFGLGDSSYEKFNSAARKLAKRLQHLGSEDILPIGLGDDQSKYGYFTELDSWTNRLLPLLLIMESSRSILNRTEPNDKNQISPDHYLVTSPDSTTAIQDAISYEVDERHQRYSEAELIKLKSRFPPPDNFKILKCQKIPSPEGSPLPIVAQVKEISRMTEQSWNQDVRHVVLSLPIKDSVGTKHNTHIAGDVATIFPVNDPDLVARIIAVVRVNEINLTARSVITIKCLTGYVKRKSRVGDIDGCTLSRLFSSFLDIAGVPQRGFFEGLASYATSEEEKEKLLEICSGEGTDLYYDYCLKEKRNYVEVLEDFRSARAPLHKLLELLPVLQPRHYSIANSGLLHPNEIHLCVAVTSSKTPYGRVRLGVCSAYLSSLNVGDEVVLWVREGSFKLPLLSDLGDSMKVPVQPMILIGPGTGVAPMRALIQERRVLLGEDNGNKWHTLLFFGCRSRNNDFLYSTEWESIKFQERGPCAGEQSSAGDPDVFEGSTECVVVAFSRDQPNKVYVTDKIREHGAAVWRLLTEGASVFISGSAKNMPSDVRKALKGVIISHGLKSDDEASAILSSLEKKGKYVVEAWS